MKQEDRRMIRICIGVLGIIFGAAFLVMAAGMADPILACFGITSVGGGSFTLWATLRA